MEIERKALTQDEIIRELIQLLKNNNMQQKANDVYESAAYMDVLEQKLDQVTEELSEMRKQLREMQEKKVSDSVKETITGMVERMENRCTEMKASLLQVKADMRTKAAEIVDGVKKKGKEALNRVSEFFGVQKNLEKIRDKVKESIKDTNHSIEKIEALGAGIREANATMTNAFRTFAEKPEKEQSKKEKKFSITEAILKPWRAEKKLLESMKLHLDASIDKVENLSRDVQIERMKAQMHEIEKNTKEHPKAVPVENVEIPVERVQGEVVPTASYYPAIVAENTHVYGSEMFEDYQTKQAEPVKAVEVKADMVKADKPKSKVR